MRGYKVTNDMEKFYCLSSIICDGLNEFGV